MLGVLAAAWLAGCSTSVPIRSQGVRLAGQGESEALVFPAFGGAAEGAEFARRDDALAIRDVRTAFEESAWPEPSRPSLDRARYLHLWDHHADVVLYFRRHPRTAW
ncbi:MAG: hypothetical protein SFY69_03585 [Planctomycetota bacterium]|nr:hypothetical protein [Planctomycetota bacterium]